MKHQWVDGYRHYGEPHKVCSVCGASKGVYEGQVTLDRIMIRITPAMLNGKRQPFCPGPPAGIADLEELMGIPPQPLTTTNSTSKEV